MTFDPIDRMDSRNDAVFMTSDAFKSVKESYKMRQIYRQIHIHIFLAKCDNTQDNTQD